MSRKLMALSLVGFLVAIASIFYGNWKSTPLTFSSDKSALSDINRISDLLKEKGSKSNHIETDDLPQDLLGPEAEYAHASEVAFEQHTYDLIGVIQCKDLYLLKGSGLTMPAFGGECDQPNPNEYKQAHQELVELAENGTFLAIEYLVDRHIMANSLDNSSDPGLQNIINSDAKLPDGVRSVLANDVKSRNPRALDLMGRLLIDEYESDESALLGMSYMLAAQLKEEGIKPGSIKSEDVGNYIFADNSEALRMAEELLTAR